MSLYFAYNSNNLKKEIRSLQKSLTYNKKQFKLIKEEIKSGNSIYSYRELIVFALLVKRIEAELEETLKGVF